MCKKLCPYRTARDIERLKQKNRNEDGELVSVEYTIVTDHIPFPCLSDQCGAWHNGRCCYHLPMGANV